MHGSLMPGEGDLLGHVTERTPLQESPELAPGDGRPPPPLQSSDAFPTPTVQAAFKDGASVEEGGSETTWRLNPVKASIETPKKWKAAVWGAPQLAGPPCT